MHIQLKRIAKNSLNFESSEPSQAKDALFELEFLQYIRLRKLKAILAEPDIVADLSFGEYYIACKTINSQKGLVSRINDGGNQIKRYGHGCIALNLEPHTFQAKPFIFETFEQAEEALDRFLKFIYEKRSLDIKKELKKANFDGLIFQGSFNAKIKESKSDIDSCTHTIYYSRENCQELDSIKRFNEFKIKMSTKNNLWE